MENNYLLEQEETRLELPILDGLEVLSVKKQQSAFPEHYHDTFCISIIEDGLEAIRMEDNLVYSEKGMISINNPFEVHANPIVNKDVTNSFTTLYLKPDLVDFYLGEKGIHFHHQQGLSAENNQLFSKVINAITTRKPEAIEYSLGTFLNSLKRASLTELEDIKGSYQNWGKLSLFIEEHLEEKVNLNLLARFMHMDKYNFAKQFRLRYGLSPINYVMMRKIFKAKDLIGTHTNLTQLAYQFNFADLAHFSKQFKRFIGLSPKAYKKQLI